MPGKKLFFHSNFRKVILTLDFYLRCCSITLVRNAGIPVTMHTPYATVLTPKVSISISKLQYGVWKSQKKSHSTLRAKRATLTFWVDKSLLKCQKWLIYFWKTEAWGQTVLPDMSDLTGQKLVENTTIEIFNFQTIKSKIFKLYFFHIEHWISIKSKFFLNTAACMYYMCSWKTFSF